jgi:xanthine dehydrogenase accessory factor
MTGWLARLAALEEAGEPAVLVTLIAARGSTPREAGCKMVVAAAGQEGTIGGGNLEYQATRIARDMLASGACEPSVRDFPLGPALGQCCGGAASVLFEPIRPVAWRLALFGAGHVGSALVRLLGELPCRVDWFDGRANAFPEILPANVRTHASHDPAALVGGLASGSRVLVMTHDHALDYTIIAAALARNDLPLVGVIGSETKRARFVHRLARAGLDRATIDRLICPIGLPGVGGKRAAEIAVSIAAQLLALHDVTRPDTSVDIGDEEEAGCGAVDCACAEKARA